MTQYYSLLTFPLPLHKQDFSLFRQKKWTLYIKRYLFYSKYKVQTNAAGEQRSLVEWLAGVVPKFGFFRSHFTTFCEMTSNAGHESGVRRQRRWKRAEDHVFGAVILISRPLADLWNNFLEKLAPFDAPKRSRMQCTPPQNSTGLE